MNTGLFVVVSVLLLIFIGISAYLLGLDKKVRKVEQMVDDIIEEKNK